MSKLVIKKRVSLEFLGDEYKEAYIDFRSIPVGDYDNLLSQISEVKKDTEANKAILEILKKYYLGGKFPNDDGALEDLEDKEELNGLDRDSVLECFGKLTGQDLKGMLRTKAELKAQGTPEEELEQVGVDVDPKSDTPSKSG